MYPRVVSSVLYHLRYSLQGPLQALQGQGGKTRSRLDLRIPASRCPPPRLPAAINYYLGVVRHPPCRPITHPSLSRHDPQSSFLLLPTLRTACILIAQARVHGGRGGARVHRPLFCALFLLVSPANQELYASCGHPSHRLHRRLSCVARPTTPQSTEFTATLPLVSHRPISNPVHDRDGLKCSRLPLVLHCAELR